VERKSKHQAARVLELIDAYLPHAKDHQRPRSYKETERHLLRHASPLHYERVEAVRRRDIAELLEKLTKRSGPIAANRLRSALSALWGWGLRSGLIEADSNPVAFTLRRPERARERTVTDAELKAIWKSTEDDGDYARIVRLCLLSGCRREEIGRLRLDEIKHDRLVIGGKRMKGGITHEVPLMPMIAAALPSTPGTSSEYVFGRRGTGFSGWSKAKDALDAKIAKEGAALTHWTLHDLRRTFSTRLHDAGVEPLVVEALLAHKQRGIAAIYNRASFWKAKCATLELWHSLLSNIVK
jgi:integrase